MFRRDFIHRVTVAGVSGLAGVASVKGVEPEVATRTYRIKGFSCVTCAVGLEVMLREQKGVLGVKASYPDAIVVIDFDPNLIAESSLVEFIASTGFAVEKKSP